ncbi:hypothetical protein ASE00_07675 [Sphingomonas sp. Root710]|uniref:cytochrome c oxidase assembly protein n=1 Tax=Sphingomonas sp. Root710 TaxID=1736594 RepID=UPI0007013752|nr:cytochrome c oxidase assembly protein [Sphingomonas sp. Root710]KRB86559.1 hypothetical protein ASE00_07675 [Sphingomonas sp. Root710]
MPGGLLDRFNIDPPLILALLLAAALHTAWMHRHGKSATLAISGWATAAAAFISPLCALSVSLFSARVGQHMILLLIAAPLLAAGLPRVRGEPWAATALFFVLLWLWHMPAPYAATFTSDAIYWTMHVSLFGSGIWLWASLLNHDARSGFSTLAAGTITSVQMGMLGAVLTLSRHAMFTPHYFTTEAWGFTPLSDQQLGGALMWVPGCLLFLWVGTRSFRLAWRAIDGARAA